MQNKMVNLSPNISINTFHVNGLKTPIKVRVFCKVNKNRVSEILVIVSVAVAHLLLDTLIYSILQINLPNVLSHFVNTNHFGKYFNPSSKQNAL